MNDVIVNLPQLLLKGTDRHLDAGTVSSVVITGLVVVFIGLILLIICVSIYGKIFEGLNNKKAAKLKAESEAKAAPPVKAEVKAPEPAPMPDIEDGIEEEIVAVIAAAIAAMSAQSGKKLALRSVKTAKPRRSAWASAGIAENTRPF